MEIDLIFAASVIAARERFRMGAGDQVMALSDAYRKVEETARQGPGLDFAALRQATMLDDAADDAEVMFRYITQEAPDPGFLRFESAPSDFSAVNYKRINGDLRHMSDRIALIHYMIYGRSEGRRYV
jgi:hypothetical protein